jgi:hypothetical protein
VTSVDEKGRHAFSRWIVLFFRVEKSSLSDGAKEIEKKTLKSRLLEFRTNIFGCFGC